MNFKQISVCRQKGPGGDVGQQGFIASAIERKREEAGIYLLHWISIVLLLNRMMTIFRTVEEYWVIKDTISISTRRGCISVKWLLKKLLTYWLNIWIYSSSTGLRNFWILFLPRFESATLIIFWRPAIFDKEFLLSLLCAYVAWFYMPEM